MISKYKYDKKIIKREFLKKIKTRGIIWLDNISKTVRKDFLGITKPKSCYSQNQDWIVNYPKFDSFTNSSNFKPRKVASLFFHQCRVTPTIIGDEKADKFKKSKNNDTLSMHLNWGIY